MPPAPGDYRDKVANEAKNLIENEIAGAPGAEPDPTVKQTASASSGAFRVDRIKAAVQEALAGQGDGEEGDPSSREPQHRSEDPRSLDVRRQRLRELVAAPPETDSPTDAGYLGKLRDEVAETLVLGEATGTAREAPSAPVEAISTDGSGDYLVQPGDSLWKIAKNRLGDGYKWTLIYKANSDRLKGAEMLRIGQPLRLPAL